MALFPTAQAIVESVTSLSAPKIGDWCNAVRNAQLIKDEGKRTWRTTVGHSNAQAWPDGPEVPVPTLALEVRETRKTGSTVWTVAAAPLTEFSVPRDEASNETEWETRLPIPFDQLARGFTEWLKLLSDATAKHLANPKQ